MRTRKMLAFEIAVIALFAMPLRAQEKEKPREAGPQLSVQVVFNEYEGEKKVSSLPYTLPIQAERNHPPTVLRMGIRVPINTGGVEGKVPKFTYQDVGTNIDCSAEPVEGGSFVLRLNTDRSSVYRPKESPNISEEQPLFSQFRTNLTLVMRDGQTVQSTMATDPVSGRVLKIDVTLRVVK